MTDNVYNIDRIDPKAAPTGFKDDINLANYVPAPCQVACPIGTDAPSYIGYIWENKIEEAFEAITATNPFSSICGRVCDAPCEPACRRTDSDGPIAIRNLKRYVMEQLGKDYALPSVSVTKNKTIGIVGSGPAGMTAAQDLAEAGYEVHIYELTDRLGGMMTWGIPAFRLPQDTIKEDMNRILSHCPGIKVHLNTPLGEEYDSNCVTLKQLKDRHDAVLLTIGAWWGKSMHVQGDDDPRVVDGVGYLRRINNGERPNTPSIVVVVGGGDVAMDACRAAKRMPGCHEVKVVYRRGPEEIPARKDELEGAIKENIEFIYNSQPTAIIPTNSKLKLRCVKTSMGDLDKDGRRSPVNVEGSDYDIDCGMVIMAVGQQSESEHLKNEGLMDVDRVKTDWASMQTDEESVFAAGDGAFGGSTIVMAMHHGHRAAYYVKAFLEGHKNPIPYRTPFKTRNVPIAQDADWELLDRQEQEFHGLGSDPVSFPEIESTYDRNEAIKEAARCYRCDVETGASDYTVRNREDIFVMARTAPADEKTQEAILQKRLNPRCNPYPIGGRPNFDDLVFLPANLSRLVIDPYRDDCNVGTTIAKKLTIASPSLITGFDDAPHQIQEDVGYGIYEHGGAYLGKKNLPKVKHWIQLIDNISEIDDTASGYISLSATIDFQALKEQSNSKLCGVIIDNNSIKSTLNRALKYELDVILANGDCSLTSPWDELNSHCNLELVRDSISYLRENNREEDVEFLYFGGIRSGTDIAKVISLGCRAGILGVTAAMAIGGTIEDNTIAFYSNFDQQDRQDGVINILKACAGEASIMARCTGKTDVHNLEPEDLRSVTIATARAAGVPLSGTNKILAPNDSACIDYVNCSNGIETSK